MIAAVALAGFAALASLELRRPDRRHRALRVAAVAAAVAGLATMLIQPSRSVRRAGGRAVLLTEGASGADAARIADSAGAAHVIRLADSTADAAGIRARLPGVSELVVTGWGLDRARLAEFAEFGMTFVPSPLPDGVTHAEWPARIADGDELVVTGRVNGVRGHAFLAAVDGSADSAPVSPDSSFTLRVLPGPRGPTQLLLRAGGVTDTVHALVVPPRPLRLLVLRAAPDFESSRLRDWVAGRGGSVAMRIRISTGRWRTEQVNARFPPLTPLAAGSLSRFDVVVIDAASWRGLSASERGALDRAVRDEGLGMIVDAVTPPFAAAARSGGAVPARVRLGTVLTPVVTLEPVTLAVRPGTATLVRDEHRRPVVQWRALGAGRVATSLVANPSRWQRAGEPELFERYWADLLGVVARPAARWAMETMDLPLAGSPIRISRLGELAGHAVIQRPDAALDTVVLATRLDSSGADGIYWPRLAGTHLVAGAGDTATFLVHGAGAWRAMRAARRRDATLAWTALRAQAPRSGMQAPVREPYPRWWFFTLFLAGATGLWWERRRMIGDDGKEGRTGV